MTPFWLSAFLDLPPREHEVGARFWAEVTGYEPSPSRGEHGEFATLLPRIGDDYLRVQRLDDGPGRIHLDLHVTDPRAAADLAIAAGASEVADRGHVVLRSPAAIEFCYVTHPGSMVPPPATWPGTRSHSSRPHNSRIDQVCLDLPPEVHVSEVAFWAGLLGAPAVPLTTEPAYVRITPPWTALEVLVQRLDEPAGPQGRARIHLDLGCSDRRAEVARHEAAGAAVRREHARWTVMTSPTGSDYCLVDRVPR